MALNSAITMDRVIPSLAFEEPIGQLQTASTTSEKTGEGTDLLDDAINNALTKARQRVEEFEPLTGVRPPLPSMPLFEALYDNLGRWTGRYGSRQAQREVLRGWIQAGEDGASWLVRRVAMERNLEALDGASKALEAMSTVAASHVLAALSASTTSDDAETALKLFRILEWFPADDLVEVSLSLAAILEKSARHPNVELREAAYRCIPLVPNGEDVRMRALAIRNRPRSPRTTAATERIGDRSRENESLGMWMRRGRGTCWKKRDPNHSAHVSAAINDLIRRRDEKPSFFLVNGCEEVHRSAELFATTVLPGPE